MAGCGWRRLGGWLELEFGRDEFRAAFGLPETAINLSDGKNTEEEPYGGSFIYIDGKAKGMMLIVR